MEIFDFNIFHFDLRIFIISVHISAILEDSSSRAGKSLTYYA